MLNLLPVDEGANNQSVLLVQTSSSKIIGTRSLFLLDEVGQVEMLATEDALAAVENSRPDRQVVALLQLLQGEVGKTGGLLALRRIVKEVPAKLDLQDFIDCMDICATSCWALGFVSDVTELHPELDVAAEILEGSLHNNTWSASIIIRNACCCLFICGLVQM